MHKYFKFKLPQKPKILYSLKYRLIANKTKRKRKYQELKYSIYMSE